MPINTESLPGVAILILDDALSHLSRAEEAEKIQDATEHIAKAKEAITTVLNMAREIAQAEGEN